MLARSKLENALLRLSSICTHDDMNPAAATMSSNFWCIVGTAKKTKRIVKYSFRTDKEWF
jgi:hypothetical protein